MFEKALAKYDGVAEEERAVLTYLVAELWRRIGDLGQAREWFDRVSDEISDESSQHWILAAAEQQRTDPQEWFA
jgi:outer membrane PBP1 activator LpoA protein